jgi:hypothetical protein
MMGILTKIIGIYRNLLGCMGIMAISKNQDGFDLILENSYAIIINYQ